MSPEPVNPAVMVALNGPDWNHTFARAVLHADTTIRKYIWQGFRLQLGAGKETSVGGKSANDFVLGAVEKLLEGKRAYDPARDLLANLNSITDSLIWSEKKRSDRTGIVDYVERDDDDEDRIDPISAAQEADLTADKKLVRDELREDQRRCFKDIRASFDGDWEMQEYLDALSEAIFKRVEISELTGIPVEQLDELRRKLVKYARRFFGVPDFGALQRRLNEGK